MKYRIYIDEVGNSDLKSSENPNHRYLSLTGVVVELDYIKKVLSPQMENLKSKYFEQHPDEPIIFHRKELVNKKYPFSLLNNPELEKAFNNDFLECLSKWNFKIITVLIDKKEHSQKYSVWRYDPYHYAMAIIFERYHLRLKEIRNEGDMMFESRGGKEDMRLKESYRKIFKDGTDYIKPEDIDETLTSKELKIKQKSANISGLQLADLIAYPCRKFVLNFYHLQTDNRNTFNDKIIDVIKPKFFQKDNKIDGYGVKLLP
ncbi:MAG: hypothetical protein A2033_17855 [Bacteroidetes bacterium GWA2_31_9]|nr:MAG: hypothetical protein A2033_17855 [Bacteroidetes bacterium GWA2_31_9]